MLILYYSPGASSIIPHIILEEIGAPYERKLVNLAKGDHKSAAYLQINPRGKVPTLSIGGHVLTENVAILTFLAKHFPDARLLPQNLTEEASCLSLMAWFASAVHPTFAHIIRPERFASDTAAQLNVSETARSTFWGHCEEINGALAAKQWMVGAQYTVSDPYAFFFYDLGARINLPMRELSAYTAFNERMLERHAVQKVRELEEASLGGATAWDGPYFPHVRRS
jgi:glutathione S-transferase